MNSRIESVRFDADQKLVSFIQKKLDKLDQYCERILDAHVVLRLENSGQVKDKIIEVKIDVPGDLIVAKESNRTFEAATDDVVDVLKRQLVKYKEKVRSY